MLSGTGLAGLHVIDNNLFKGQCEILFLPVDPSRPPPVKSTRRSADKNR